MTRKIVAWMAARRWSNWILNQVYLHLPWSALGWIHHNLAKIFVARNLNGRGAQGRTWRIRFLGKSIGIPLNPASMWLDWDLAVSVLGHDTEVKQTYMALLQDKASRPDLFIDIGANYGTHAILFAAHGVDVLAFEPLAECRQGIERLLNANQVEARIESCCLGRSNGTVEIKYPAGETWLASVDHGVIEKNERSREMVSTTVILSKLDDYLEMARGKRVLIKIDTEGAELDVLAGGQSLIQEIRPIIIFETFRGDGRKAIHESLNAMDYEVFTLPLNPANRDSANRDSGLDLEEFLRVRQLNFAAVWRGFRI